MTGPYATAAPVYWQAGWRGILPLPERKKKDPPKGYTGSAGIDPVYSEIQGWIDRKGSGNVALRMPPNVIGLDVDAYGDKPGAETLQLAEAQHGTLPPTWRTTSRDDGVSGIRLYRVPEGLAWPGEIGGATEIIQTRHRYAVVWPSVHPETGKTYRWIGPDGVVSTTVPDPDALPVLPDAWVQAYTGGELAVTVARATVAHTDALAWVASRAHATEPPCTRMTKGVEAFTRDLRGSAHNSARDAVLRVARLADGDHYGAVTALAEIRGLFIADATSPDRTILGKTRRTKDEAVYEFGELVSSAVGLVIADKNGSDPCDCFGQITGLVVAAPTHATDGSLALEPAPVPEAAPSVAEDGLASRFFDGASFILDAPDKVPSLWGDGDDCLWAEGEALMLCGPPGVGKTTLTGQVLRGLLGLQPKVLGLPVRETRRNVLYLAMDRPAQIARGLRRTFKETDRQVLRERVRVWPGPPPGDVARHPTVLLSLAQLADADVVIVDSVKDAAVGLSDDEVGAGYNRARQQALANGVEVLELHHMVKRGANGAKPKELADVYGSTWLTAGAGSVALLWGAAGDPIVELVHLKQPASEVGPWKLQHDHDGGVTTRFVGNDILEIVAAAGWAGLSAKDVAKTMYDAEKPTPSQVEKARRQLEKRVADGLLARGDQSRDSWSGGKDAAIYRVAGGPESQSRSNHAADFTEPTHGAPSPITESAVSGVNPNHDPNHANHETNHDIPITIVPPSLEGDERAVAAAGRLTLDCNGCGDPFNAEFIEKNKGYCHDCGKRR